MYSVTARQPVEKPLGTDTKKNRDLESSQITSGNSEKLEVVLGPSYVELMLSTGSFNRNVIFDFDTMFF